MNTEVGRDIYRKEAWQKVTGEAEYTDDFPATCFLHARMTVSPHPHARIINIDIQEALSVPGVKIVMTGDDCLPLSGTLIQDRPLLARDTVRYAGEPVALVVALNEAAASLASEKIHVTYEPLPAVFDARTATEPNAPVLHTELSSYICGAQDVYPQDGSNISSCYPIRKGDINYGFQKSDFIVTREFNLPPSGHIAMELRTARTQILRDGTVEITTASQSPYEVAKQISEYFGIPTGKVRVRVPFVGGAFGGKAPVTLELLACMASQKLSGQPVRIAATRQHDMITLPCRSGFQAKIKLGADKNGTFQAAEITFLVDNGAYADIGPYMAKAIAASCTGPYNIKNLSCDSLSVYTNKTYATSFRGFAHESATFCVERTINALAFEMKADPLELRRINAIRPDNLTPSQVKATPSNIGNLENCLERIKTLCGWGSLPEQIGEHTVRAKGCACFWKSPTPPTDAVSGAVVTVNSDGSFNLSTGVVEMGNGGQTLLAQMFADRLGVSSEQVHIDFTADTRTKPEHYKTVASFTPYIAGRAVMRAADDVLAQIRTNASLALKCIPEDIEVNNGRAFLRHDTGRYVLLKDILSGYSSPETGSLGDPVIGRGGFMLKGLSNLDPQTGKGETGPSWTVGVQAVEVELDTRNCSYKIINAWTVMDIGKILNPAEQKSMVIGGMAMGLSMASREVFKYENGMLTTPSLRTYKMIHFGERPRYHVEFTETPQEDAPYDSRCMAEHGIIGMPAALANALAAASGIAVDTLPVTPESLWRARGGGGP